MSRMGIMGSLRRSPLSRVSFACVTRFPFTSPLYRGKGTYANAPDVMPSTNQQLLKGRTGQDGCPTFAPAYVGRRRGGEAPTIAFAPAGGFERPTGRRDM